MLRATIEKYGTGTMDPGTPESIKRAIKVLGGHPGVIEVERRKSESMYGGSGSSKVYRVAASFYPRSFMPQGKTQHLASCDLKFKIRRYQKLSLDEIEWAIEHLGGQVDAMYTEGDYDVMIDARFGSHSFTYEIEED